MTTTTTTPRKADANLRLIARVLRQLEQLEPADLAYLHSRIGRLIAQANAPALPDLFQQ